MKPSDRRSKGTLALDARVAAIRACRICVDEPRGPPLPHAPRPVLRVSATARIAVCGQAPGTRVHVSGLPFTDPSGDRLRDWMGVTEAEFYDQRQIAIIPMGFCFPGLDAKGGDRLPRRECAATWHTGLLTLLPQLDLLLLVGGHALRWHLPDRKASSLSELVAEWRTISGLDAAPDTALQGTRTHPAARAFPLPHPSWRNNAWLTARPWFATDLLPALRHEVRLRLDR